MDKPKNPYQKGTLIWSVMEGDWEDLAAAQIAEVLGTDISAVRQCLHRIKEKTGYDVPRVRWQAGRRRGENEKSL